MSARGVPLLLVLLAAPHAGAQTRLQVDTLRSRIAFSVPIAGGLGSLSGRFTGFDVSVLYDGADVTASSLKARIRAASIDTGSELVDARLRGPEFLAADRYPEILFQSRRVVRWDHQYLAVGDLTIRGVTKRIAVPFRLVASGADGAGRTVLGAAARALVDWRDYAVGSGWRRAAVEKLLGSQVTLEVDLWTRPAGADPGGGRAPPP